MQHIEEERCILYVGMVRTVEIHYLSYIQIRILYEKGFPQQLFWVLQEMPLSQWFQSVKKNDTWKKKQQLNLFDEI